MVNLIYAMLFFIFACSSGSPGLVTYGGEDYETVVIGEQTWFKRNLNYVPTGTGIATNSRCYEDDDYNCAQYGHLYNWATAMALPDNCNRASCASQIKTPHKGICPNGWHIPSEAEWKKLIDFAGGSDIAGAKLKATSGWNAYESASGNGEDKFGFSALPGGTDYPEDGHFYNAGNSGYWWSASEINSTNAFRRGMYYDSESIGYYSYGKSLLLSVRCVKD